MSYFITGNLLQCYERVWFVTTSWCVIGQALIVVCHVGLVTACRQVWSPARRSWCSSVFAWEEVRRWRHDPGVHHTWNMSPLCVPFHELNHVWKWRRPQTRPPWRLANHTQSQTCAPSRRVKHCTPHSSRVLCPCACRTYLCMVVLFPSPEWRENWAGKVFPLVPLHWTLLDSSASPYNCHLDSLSSHCPLGLLNLTTLWN